MKAVNRKQIQTESISETFSKANQDPWKYSSAEFAAHLNKLEKDSMYKTNVYPTALDLDEV